MHQTIVIDKDKDVENQVYIKLVDMKGRMLDSVTIVPVGKELVMH